MFSFLGFLKIIVPVSVSALYPSVACWLVGWKPNLTSASETILPALLYVTENFMLYVPQNLCDCP